MPFDFLKYLQPIHYFRLLTAKGHSVFPEAHRLPESVLQHLHLDAGYASDIAQQYDLSWQAVQKGYIGDCQTYGSFETLPLQDQYRFIRTYFHVAWVLYVLLLRLFSLHNPISEVKAWYHTRHVKRQAYQAKPILPKDWASFESKMVLEQPLVSVIIPTLNRYDYLKDVLTDFEAQDYPHFEIIIVDQSDAYDPTFYASFNLKIQVIRQTEKALWLARNTAIKNAKGTLIALSEDDVRIPPDWISNHLKCLDYFDAAVSAGVFYPEGQSIPLERSYFAIASQFATGNAMLYKDVFKTVGLFDRQFEKQRMGDGEFGARVYLSGLRSVSNPYASCVDVKAGEGGLREMGSWDAFRPSNWWAPRPIPSVLYYYRTYYGDHAARLSLLKTVPLSIMPYRFKKHKPLLVVGAFLSLLLLPLVAVQVYRSWKLSDAMLQKGALITYLAE